MSVSFLRTRSTREYGWMILFLIMLSVMLEWHYIRECKEESCSKQKKSIILWSIIIIDVLVILDSLMEIFVYGIAYGDQFKDYKFFFSLVVLFNILLIVLVGMHTLKIRDELMS
jgi:hypothetical protein